jgi:hypothetical protein
MNTNEVMEALYETRLDIENAKRVLDQSRALLSMFIYRPQSLEYTSTSVNGPF